MRDMRESSAAIGAGPDRLSAGKVKGTVFGGGGGSSGKLKVFETKKENKRRLILSDSESGDDWDTPHHQKAVAGAGSRDMKGNGSGARKVQFEGSAKNGKKAGVSVKRVGQRDYAKCRQDGGSDLKSSVYPGLGRKRSREALQNGLDDVGVSLKKIKTDSLKYGKDKGGEMDAELKRLDSMRCGVGKALIRLGHPPGSKQPMDVDEGKETPGNKRVQAHLKGNRICKVETDSWLEHSNQKAYRLPKHNISSSNAQPYTVSSDGTGFRLQGKGGVLKLLPSNKKFAGQSTSHVEEESDESRKSPGSSRGTNKTKFSEGRKSLKKPGRSFVTDEYGKSLQCSGGADQCRRYPSLSADRKLLKKMSCTSVTGEARKSPVHSSFVDQITPKHLSFYEGRKSLKKQDSPIKEENGKNPRHSGGAVRVTSKCTTTSEDRMPLKNSGSSISEDTKKCSGRSSFTASLPEDRKSIKNPGSSTHTKRHAGPRRKGLEIKKEADNLSPQRDSKGAVNLCKTAELDRKASKLIKKTPLSYENNIASGKVSRSTEKRKLRDLIKSMLFDAGWTIDFRPRKGRNYEDAVYVSPRGIGYWSITKAYSAFQEQCHNNEETGNEKGEELHGQLSRESSTNACNHNGRASQFSAIPSELLNILKRNVVQKRRRRIEVDERATGSKSAKNKKKVVAAKKRINENSVVGSSRKKNKKGRGCTLLARTSNAEADSEDDGYVPYAGKRSVLAWLIDSGTVPANGKVKYMNRRRTRTMLEGLITRDGIHCSCCSKILTVSKFEIHAGSKLNQPYANIFVEESRLSLLQCQLDAWDKQKESERCAFHLIDITDDDPNDDTCAICGDGGDLICCDSCPSTFHLSCLGIQMLPPGDWHCTNCLCRFCGVANSSSVEDNSVTGSLSLLSCALCEGKYHNVCIPEADVTLVDSKSSSLSFCGKNCGTLFERLQNLLGVKNDLDAGFSWTLVRRLDDESLNSCSNFAQRADCNSKIAVALAVMNECFLPITDRRSGINLIHNVLYNRGSNFNRLDYSGFYTFVLERGDEIISAASIRIHGTKLAEMPFIGTRDRYRRQGMCRRLLNVIEVTLGSLKVEKLVIPAISELMHTWTTVFGFKPLDDSDKQGIKSMNMLVFPDTGLLQKALLEQGNSITKEEGLGPIENDAAMVSNGPPDLHTSDDGTVSCILEIKDEIGIKRPGSPSSNISVEATPELSLQHPDVSSDAPFRSDSEAIRCKSFETVSPDGESSVYHNDGFHEKLCGGSILCSGSPVGPKNKLPCDVPSLDDAEVQSQDNATHSGGPPVNKLLIQEPLDINSKSSDASTTSRCAGKLSEYGSEQIHHSSSELREEFSQLTVLCNNPTLDVATVIDTHNKEGEASALADNISNCDSHHILEVGRLSPEATVDVPCADQPSLHRVGDDALHDTGKVVVEANMIKRGICAFHKDPHLCTSEDFASEVEVVHQVKACKNIAYEVLENTSHRGCLTDDGSQVSEHCIQRSEPPQGCLEFSCDTALPSASRTSLRCNGDNNMCAQSISYTSLHSNSEGMLQNVHEMNNEGSVRGRTLEVHDESLRAASKCDLPVPCGDKATHSQNKCDNSSDAADALTLDACEHNLHEMQKDLQMVIPPSKFCSTCDDIVADKHVVEDGASSVVSNHHAPIEEYKCCIAEVMKPNGSISGDRCSF